MPTTRTKEQHEAPVATTGSAEFETDSLATVDEILLGAVRKFEYFGTDETDEFQITREDGTKQGIFKVWAGPIIPIVENIDLDIDTAISKWTEALANKPLSLYQCLEQWRAYAEIMDRRLQIYFSETELPPEGTDRAVELFARMHVAFALAAPFYNIEALVADGRPTKEGNPINFDVKDNNGGLLDIAAMLLPSALADKVKAERLDWGNLDWPTLQGMVAEMKSNFLTGDDENSSRQFVLLSKVAELSGMSIEQVLFAVNALQFIPADVGGKKGDLPQSQAIGSLENLFADEPEDPSSKHIARDMNALIRFHNWRPVIKSDDNFEGRYWSYDAVCGNANQLLDEIKRNPSDYFDEDFAEIFNTVLAPQLDDLDASSAKGRFITQLFSEGRFKGHVSQLIESRIAELIAQSTTRLGEIAQDEVLSELGANSPLYLVGGKANGLRKAMELFGEDIVPGGVAITSEAVSSWLSSNQIIAELVNALEACPTVDDKVICGRLISEAIASTPLPPAVLSEVAQRFESSSRLVLRSSSYDEDVDIIGPAPGVYESVIDVDSKDLNAVSDAIRAVVSSFFSEKAISFRELKGLRHKPLMAVLVQEYIHGTSGSVFIDKTGIKMNLASQPDILNGCGNSKTENGVEEIFIPKGSSDAETTIHGLAPEQAESILWIARNSEKAFGASDIEFVIDPVSGKPQVVQIRKLRRPTKQHLVEHDEAALETVAINSLGELPELESRSLVNIFIGEEIDLEKFQGSLFRWIISNGEKIKTITLAKPVPSTCHFANIIETLGIKLY